MIKKLRYLFTLMLLFVASVGWAEDVTVSYGWEDSDDADAWTISESIVKTSGEGNTGTYAGKINTNHTYVQFNEKVYVKSFSFAFKRISNNSNYNVYVETSTDGETWTAAETYAMSSFTNGSYTIKTKEFDGSIQCYVRFHCYNTTAVRYVDDVTIKYSTSGSSLNPSDMSLTPTELTFDLYNDNGTKTIAVSTSSVGDISVSENEYVTTEINGKTISVSPKGVVTQDTQIITVTQAPDDTYGTGSATFTVVITDSTPFTGGDVTFVANVDKGTSTGQNADQITKSVVTFSCTSAALALAQYRLYKNSETTFSVPEGYYITKIVFTDADTDNPCSNLARKSGTAGEFDSETLTWTGASRTAVFVASAQARASQVVVTVVQGTPKADAGLAFEQASYTATLGETFTAPTLTTAEGFDGTVIYSSTNTDVATVNAATGAVTLVAAGETTITASSEETETYNAGSASYTLTVSEASTPGTEGTATFVAGIDTSTELTLTKDNITLTLTGGTLSRTDNYRVYANNSITISTTSDYIIKKIVFTCTGGSNGPDNFSTETETYSVTGNIGTWTGSANTITFTASAQVRATRIDVTYEAVSTDFVAVPVIEGNSPFATSTEVTITTTTEGADIYYTLDGTDPTASSTAYTAPFTLTATTTVKAIAIKGENQSGIASATFTKSTSVATVAEMNDLDDKTPFVFTGNATVVYVSGPYVYIKDNTGSSLIYKYDTGLSKGDVIKSNWQGEVSIYSNLFEAKPTTALEKDGTADVTYPEVVADAVVAENMNMVGVLKGVVYTAPEGTSKNFTITVGETEIAGYNQFGLEIAAPEEGATYDIEGAISVHNTDVQFQPISITKVENPVTITISDKATDGSKFYATLYYSDKHLVVPTGIKAAKYYVENGTLTKGVTYATGAVIPAGTAVVLEADDDGVYSFAVTTAGSPDDGVNMLHGTDATEPITEPAGCKYYMLSLNKNGDANSVGFYFANSTGAAFTNGAHKAYLAVPVTTQTQSIMGFPFGGDATGIDGLNANDNVNANEVYDLQGRRMNVNNMPKGIYIVNGKKVVIK